MKKILLPALLSSFIVIPQAASAEPVPAKTLYFGGHAGQYFSDVTDRYDYDQPADTTLPGVQVGYRISDRWSVQALWAKHDFNSEKDRYDGDLRTPMASARFHFHGTDVFGFEPYAGLAAGELQMKTRSLNDEGMVGIELGLQNRMRPHWMLDIGTRPWFSIDNERWDNAPYIALNYLVGAATQGASDDAMTDEATEAAPAPVSNISATVFGDTDGDGVTDALDHCPDTTPGTLVDEYGCESDSDGDGVSNSLDQCPDTPAGARIDDKGCNLVLTQPIRQTLYINFASGTADIQGSSLPEVEKIVLLMTQYPDARVVLEGHTDSAGSAALNEQLSQYRADAVKALLVSRYRMDERRISAIGKGEDSPIADNSTAQGRQQNRRVEVILSTGN